jgi:predicted PurR-regulated permease PerM
MPTEIKLNLKSFIFAIIIIIGIWLMVEIRGILALLFASYILMAGLKPYVDKMTFWKLPRFIAVLILYIIFITICVILGTLIIPPLVNETIRLANNFPNYLLKAATYVDLSQDTLLQQVGTLSQNALKVTIGLFSDVITFFTVAIFTFYLLLARVNLPKFLNGVMSEASHQRFISIIEKVEIRLGSWIRGQLILMLTIGMASYLGLLILGISYALPLGVIAGILEMIPNIGPIISAIPAMLIAVTFSPGLAAVVALLYLAIHQLENHLLVPQVMQKTVGVPALVSIIVLLIGGKLGGAAGVILSIPAYLVVETVTKNLLNKN